jgi:hypothetical protein
VKLVRVFPRRTNATPTDPLAFVGGPPEGVTADEVHISVTFTYDKPEAERLKVLWERVAPVKIGGPAYGDITGEFTPGRYVAHGFVIHTRGCPNSCWFCVEKNNPLCILEKLHGGKNLLDSNHLAAPLEHIQKSYTILAQNYGEVVLTGGLEAKLLTWDHVSLLMDLRPVQMFFAYDTPDDLEPLRRAGEILRLANFTRSHLRCYVLMGWAKDTMQEAEKRLMEAWEAGFLPMGMLFKDKDGAEDPAWKDFQWTWSRPAATKARVQQIYQSRFGYHAPLKEVVERVKKARKDKRRKNRKV